MTSADFILRLTDVEFCAWIAQAEPGDVLEYHRGALVSDRLPVMSKPPMAECERIHFLADRAFAAAEAGLVRGEGGGEDRASRLSSKTAALSPQTTFLLHRSARFTNGARSHISGEGARPDGDGSEMARVNGMALQVDVEEARAAVVAAAQSYFAERRTLVDPFVRRNFGLAGSVRLHRSAMGLDFLRAPANIALAPVHVAMRLGALGARRAGAGRLSKWLRTRRVLLRTSVAAEVERLVMTELLEMPWGAKSTSSGRDGLSEAILLSPQVQSLLTEGASRRTAAPVVKGLSENVRDYADVRSAVAEMTTSLAVLGAGAAAFQKITPGMMSLGPPVAAAFVQSAAIAAFPLGSGAGSLWYWMFPVEVSPLLAVGTTAGLIATGAVVAAFAGLLADPVQVRLGLHQRRLHRLIDALESEFIDGKGAGFVAREHYVARIIDLADAGFLALRQLRA